MRAFLNSDAINTPIKSIVENFHSDIIREVVTSVAKNRIVIIGMKYNGSVYQARKALEKESIVFTYLEYGNYTSQWRRRLALKMWSGWPTFPMVFVDQILIGGKKDLFALLRENPKLSLELGTTK